MGHVHQPLGPPQALSEKKPHPVHVLTLLSLSVFAPTSSPPNPSSLIFSKLSAHVLALSRFSPSAPDLRPSALQLRLSSGTK